MKLKLMGVEYKRTDGADGEAVHTITVTTRPRPAEAEEADGSNDRSLYTVLVAICQNAAGIFAEMAQAPPERPCKVVPFGPVDREPGEPEPPPDGRAS